MKKKTHQTIKTDNSQSFLNRHNGSAGLKKIVGCQPSPYIPGIYGINKSDTLSKNQQFKKKSIVLCQQYMTSQLQNSIKKIKIVYLHHMKINDNLSRQGLVSSHQLLFQKKITRIMSTTELMIHVFFSIAETLLFNLINLNVSEDFAFIYIQEVCPLTVRITGKTRVWT